MTTKLQIGNIPKTVTDKDLEVLFRKYGHVDAVGITKDPGTGLSAECGFVQMCNAADAESAISGLNFTQYAGRTIGVCRAQIPQS